MGLSWLWGCLIFCEPVKLQGLSYSMYRLGWLDTSRWGHIGLSGRGHSLGGRCWSYRSLFVSVLGDGVVFAYLALFLFSPFGGARKLLGVGVGVLSTGLGSSV